MEREGEKSWQGRKTGASRSLCPSLLPEASRNQTFRTTNIGTVHDSDASDFIHFIFFFFSSCDF